MLMESLIGSLVHCSLAIPVGKPMLAGLIVFMAAFPKSCDMCFLQCLPSPQALSDATWWANCLATTHEGILVIAPPLAVLTPMFTDTSTSFSIEITIDDEFVSFCLRPSWKSHCQDIGWTEAIVVKWAIHWLMARGLCDASVTIHCDNQGVVYPWMAGRPRNEHQNNTIVGRTATAATHGVQVTQVYVNTVENPADALSHNISPPSFMRTLSPPAIPNHLAGNMLTH